MSLEKLSALLNLKIIDKLNDGLNSDFTALENLLIDSAQNTQTALSSLSLKLNDIDTKLNRIENLIKNLSTYTGEYLNLLTSQLSAANWNGGNPGSVAAVLDGNDNTFSDWGNGYGSGNKGYFQVDLQSVIAGIVEIKSDVALNASWGENKIRYFIESSGDGQNFNYIHTKDVSMTVAGEIQITSSQFNARFIRWGLLDVGNGAGKMRTAYLKVKI